MRAIQVTEYRGGVTLPFVPGVEIVGRTTNGRRILSPVFETGGGSAEYAVAPKHRAVDVPDEVSDGQALALLIQGLTAWHVLRKSARLECGDSVLVNAADGGVDVVLDPTGGAATQAGLDCLRDFGRLVNYGNAGREGRPPIDPSALAQRNLSVAGFWLVPAMELPGKYAEPLAAMLDLTARRQLRPLVGAEYPLADARRSHEDLLARRTTGKLILRP